MDSLTVLRVDWFGEESATVTLSSGQAEVSVFCWPCEVSPGGQVVNALSCGLDGDLQAGCLDDWPAELKAERSVPRLERWPGKGPFAWRGCGRVVDAERGIVEVLGFAIAFGECPAPDGAVVEFSCERLDL